MGDEKVRNPLEAFETITQLRLEGLMQELTKRVRVVNEDALTHLVDRGVLAPVGAWRVLQAGRRNLLPQCENDD